jgi:Helix-turn-helix domain
MGVRRMPKGFSYLFDADALIEARIDAGLTLDDVSRATGFDIGGLRACEHRGRDTKVNRAILRAVADLYGVAANSFVRTKHEPYNGYRKHQV